MLKDETLVRAMDSNIWKINCVDLLTKPIIFAPSDYNRYIQTLLNFFYYDYYTKQRLNQS